jgi:integrase/recombinase XerD
MTHPDSPDENGTLFRPLRKNRTGRLERAITAPTNALDHQADIAKMQEWLGHANISTTRIYDHRARSNLDRK